MTSREIEAERRWPWIASLLAAPLALAIFAGVAPLVPLPRGAIVLAVVLAFACVSVETLVCCRLVPAARPRALAALAIPIGALIAIALGGGSIPEVLAAGVVTLSLLAIGTMLGSVVGARIEAPGHLSVVAAVSGLVDAFSVLHPVGPTAQLVRIEAAVSVLVLPWPILGTDRIEPILGLGDVTFAALYVAAARRHRLPAARTTIALALGLLATLIAVLITGIGIPALPFLGIAVVAMHPEARRIPREDRAKAAAGVAALVIVLALLFWVRR